MDLTARPSLPKDWRLCSCKDAGASAKSKVSTERNMADGNLVWGFCSGPPHSSATCMPGKLRCGPVMMR